MKLTVCCLLLACSACYAARTHVANVQPKENTNDLRIEVDMFVMSKCPDAVYAETALAPVLEELKDIINLNLHFIGQKQDNGTWTCKHGPTECAGNTQQLCVQLHTEVQQRYDWAFKFALCNNRQGMDAIGTFTTAATCLKETGIPFGASARMLACMYGPEHQALLESDLKATAAAGITTSCTIQVEGNTICVRDGGEWKECPAGSEAKDFKDVFCASYAAKNKGSMPPTCRPAPAVAVA